MSALVEKFRAAGVKLEPTGDGNLRARGPLTDELRAAIRAHKPAILAELATAANDAQESQPDPQTECSHAKALALLAEQPTWRLAVVAETGTDPIILGVAIRGIGYGEIEIPADRYDGMVLVELMDKCGASPPTVH